MVLLRESFQRHNLDANLVVAVNGQQAIDMIDEIEGGIREIPGLVILDLNVPKRSGHEVLRHLRQTSRSRRIPVVVFTSSENHGDRKSAFALGVEDYLVKPSNLTEFMQIGSVIKRVLGKSRPS